MANKLDRLRSDKENEEANVRDEIAEFLKWPTTARMNILMKACKDYQQAYDAVGKEENADGWTEVGTQDWGDFFYQIKVDVSQSLDENEIALLSGCLGYALREQVRGEELSVPTVTNIIAGVQVPSSMTHHGAAPLGTVVGMSLEYHYDTTKTRSDDPDFAEAFRKATLYIQEGTPKRKTNRAGEGTMGTSLVNGIGRVRLKIYTK